jgi:hypothetical protein
MFNRDNKLQIMTEVSKRILIMFMLLIAGCATMERMEQLKLLDSRTDSYEAALRWGYYKLAYGFRHPQEPQEMHPDIEHLKQFKIAFYEITERIVSEDKQSARQTVQIKYYLINQLIEKTITDNQEWKYDAEMKQWFLQSGLPAFR